MAVAPHLIEQFVAGHQFAGALEQGQEDGERLGLDLLGNPGAGQDVAGGIDLHVPEAEKPRRRICTA